MQWDVEISQGSVLRCSWNVPSWLARDWKFSTFEFFLEKTQKFQKLCSLQTPCTKTGFQICPINFIRIWLVSWSVVFLQDKMLKISTLFSGLVWSLDTKKHKRTMSWKVSTQWGWLMFCLLSNWYIDLIPSFFSCSFIKVVASESTRNITVMLAFLNKVHTWGRCMLQALKSLCVCLW